MGATCLALHVYVLRTLDFCNSAYFLYEIDYQPTWRLSKKCINFYFNEDNWIASLVRHVKSGIGLSRKYTYRILYEALSLEN
jgi:hypothetical protein